MIFLRVFALLGTLGHCTFGNGINSILNSKGIFDEPLGSQSINADRIAQHLNDPVKLNAMYSKYQNAFGKISSESDNFKRKNTFKTNILKIAKHNKKARAGKASYEMGVNQFTDMSIDEIISKHTGYRPSQNNSNANVRSVSRTRRDVNIPDAVDWRDYGLVTPVKNQGGCGSCVLFSATACLESYYALTHGQSAGWIDLSEQELVDCDNGAQYPGNNGCAGNTFVPTFQYLSQVGESLESDYPYQGQDGTCQAAGKNHPAKVNNWWHFTGGDEGVLMDAVGKWGPVSVALSVSDDWAHYSSGVFTGQCTKDINHAVLAVGYGNENGQDYWILKNSWGDGWGDQGYIKHGRNMDNLCNIAGDCVSCNQDNAIAIN